MNYVRKEFTLVPYTGGYKLFYGRVSNARNLWMNCKDIPWTWRYQLNYNGTSARVFKDAIQDLKFWEILELLVKGYVFKRPDTFEPPFEVHPDAEYNQSDIGEDDSNV